MNLLERKVKEKLPYWNLKVHGITEAEEYCERNLVGQIRTDLIADLGEYRIYKETPMILIHKFVSWQYLPWVFWHEIGHDILHFPLTCNFSKGTRKKIEKEANIIAAVALIPLWVLKTKNLYEIQEEFGYPRELILLRKEIYEHNNKF